METSAPLANAILDNTLFYSNSHISQMPLQLKSFTSCAFFR